MENSLETLLLALALPVATGIGGVIISVMQEGVKALLPEGKRDSKTVNRVSVLALSALFGLFATVALEFGGQQFVVYLVALTATFLYASQAAYNFFIKRSSERSD